MNIQYYQEWTKTTAIYKMKRYYPALLLASEVGEVLGHIQKMHRDDDDIVTPDRKDKLRLELGDVLWALCRLADDLDLDMGDVMMYNHAKLTARQAKGTISGSGDYR
tara:strand:+ start:199 stop:519 length:321 start_codon:yes stop_codon:yes gene_type:complete